MGQPGVAALLRGRLPHAPHLIDAEVAHALRGLALGGKITPGDGSRRLSAWRGLDIVRIPMAGLFPRVWELRANLTAYDAFPMTHHVECVAILRPAAAADPA